MANWNDIKLNVSRAANKTIKKAGELADSASMNIKLKTLNAKLGDRFEVLGKLTYKQLKFDTSHAEEISKVIAEIDELREEIKQLKEKIAEAKEERQKSAEDVKIDEESEATEETAE